MAITMAGTATAAPAALVGDRHQPDGLTALLVGGATRRPAVPGPLSMNANRKTRPFVVRDCAMAAIATGRRAQTLRELRDNIRYVDAGSVYYHFWGSLLRPRFEDPEFNNDFASWARHGLHDPGLAERLGVIDPGAFGDVEELRHELLDVIEAHLDGVEHIIASPRGDQFHFVRGQIVVFDSGRRLREPSELVDLVASMSVGSVFYHCIDARQRLPKGGDDFRAWLSGYGDRYAPLCKALDAVDPYFVTLTELRGTLAGIFREHLGGSAS